VIIASFNARGLVRSRTIRIAAFTTTVALAVSADAFGQVDNVVTVVPSSVAVGNPVVQSDIAAFGYDALRNEIYVAGTPGAGQKIRRVSGIDGTLSSVDLVSNTPWYRFTRDGDLSRGGGVPTPGSLLLNPVAIGSVPAYSFAIITDRPGTVQSSTGVDEPELTRLVYRYNLQLDTNADAREEMTSLVTQLQYQQTPGITSTGSAFTTRQPVFSGNGQTVYFLETGAGYRGLWSVPALGGTPQRLLNDAMSSEPALINRGAGDRVLIDGTIASNNLGGIDAFDPVTLTRTALLNGTDLAAFLETTSDNIDIRSMTADAAGNVYFNNIDSSPERRGIFKLDPQGRLIKVLSRAERSVAFAVASPNNTTERMQSRTATFSGPNGSFTTTQLLYMERLPVNAVAGVYVFKPGDFNRDNAVTAVDLAAFGAKLTVRGVAINVDDSRFDLNGNNVIDWKDVKVLQSFLGFRDGDVNFDFSVNFNDLLVLAQNYGSLTGKTWVQGDFDGNDGVSFNDLLSLAQNYGLPALQSSELAQLDSEFAADWALAQSLVPEPIAIAVFAPLAMIARRRRSL
jgi:hypothetical protein